MIEGQQTLFPPEPKPAGWRARLVHLTDWDRFPDGRTLCGIRHGDDRRFPTTDWRHAAGKDPGMFCPACYAAAVRAG